MAIYFVDTSILCNLLPVPGRDQHRDEVIAEFKRITPGALLIMPVATLIETGNFIAQLSDGRVRRRTAETFKQTLMMICVDKAPWQLHLFAWDAEFLASFAEGAGTGMDVVEHAMCQLGAGDLSILTERAAYVRRTGIKDVRIWTRDIALAAYAAPLE